MITVGKNVVVSPFLGRPTRIARVIEYPVVSPISGELIGKDWVLVRFDMAAVDDIVPASICSPTAPIEFRMDALARVEFCKSQIRNVWKRRHESEDTRASIRYRILCIREYRNREVCHA